METKFILEIGSSHNQDFGRVKKLLKGAKDLGVYGVKFQLFDPNTLYKNSKYKKELEKKVLPIKFIPKIKNLCIKYNLKFGCSVFYNEAIEILDPYVDFFKISSFDFFRQNLIKKCLSTNKPLHLSTGLATINEIKDIYKYLDNLYNCCDFFEEFIIYHCISKYPTKTKDCCLNKIESIKDINLFENYTFNIGYSDHSMSIAAIVRAIMYNIEYIEIHYDLDDMKGYESHLGHVWNHGKCLQLKKFLNEMEKVNKKKFKLTKKDIKLRADIKTGMRK